MHTKLKSAVIILIIIMFDQLTKFFIVQKFYLGESVPVIKNIFHITYITNTGTAFGMFQKYGNILLVFSIIAIIVISVLIFKQKELPKANLISFSLILGGAIGNLIDRLFRGSIVDFIDINLHFWPANPWPTFNIADSSITVGITILFIYSIISKKNIL